MELFSFMFWGVLFELYRVLQQFLHKLLWTLHRNMPTNVCG